MRLFEGTSYIFTVFMWLWLVMILLPWLMKSGLLDILAPNGEHVVQPASANEQTSPLLIVVAGVVTMLMVALSIVALWRLPKNLVKTGSTVTQSVTEVITPKKIHSKRVTKKQRTALSKRIVFYVRIVFILLPLLGIVIAPPIDSLDFALVLVVGSTIALVATSALLFEELIRYFLDHQRRA